MNIFSLIITLLCTYFLISTFLCFHWATGTLFATHTTSFYDRKLWRIDHKILTNIIGIGGFLGVWFIISTGINHLIKIITLPLVDVFQLLGQNKEKDYILFITMLIGFYVTYILWISLEEFIGLKGKTGREEHIQYRLQDLRRDYLYNPYETYERFKEEYEEADDEAEWEEIKRAATDKLKIQIKDLRKKTKWTGKATKSRNEIRMEDELEALYRLQDEISEKLNSNRENPTDKSKSNVHKNINQSQYISSLWQQYIELHDDNSRNALMEHYLHLVKYTAERIYQSFDDKSATDHSIKLDDLISAGIFGLMDAIDAFDPDGDITFNSFSSTLIRKRILDELRR